MMFTLEPVIDMFVVRHIEVPPVPGSSSRGPGVRLFTGTVAVTFLVAVSMNTTRCNQVLPGGCKTLT